MRTHKEELPIFRKYRREYLAEGTGYSEGYLSRIATGTLPLRQKFIGRCCSLLEETEEELFHRPEEGDGN